MSKQTVQKNGLKYKPTIWRRSQYASFEEAKKSGGLYFGADCHGYAAYAESMRFASAVADCLDGGSQHNDVMVRLAVDRETIGDFPLSQSCRT